MRRSLIAIIFLAYSLSLSFAQQGGGGTGGGGTVTGATGVLPAIVSNSTTTPAVSFSSSIMNYGGDGGGSADNGTAFTNACAANTEVWVPAGTYAFTSSYAIPCAVHMGASAQLAPASTKVLTINGNFDCPSNQQCFSGAGSIKMAVGLGGVNYAEWWGVTGSADYTPINAALAAWSSGGTTQLLCKDYIITGGTVTIPASYVNLNGCAPGFSASALTGSAGSSNIKSATATGDMIDLVGGGSGNCLANAFFGNSITNLQLYRTVAPTAGFGIKLQNLCWSPRIENVSEYDAGLSGIYIKGVANSLIKRATIVWSLASAATHYGVEIDGTTPNNGTNLTDVTVVGSASIHTRGLYVHGTTSNISDIWTTHFQIANTDYCVYLDGSGNAGGATATDIHFNESICDSALVSAYYITTITAVHLGGVEISGGLAGNFAGSSPIIDIESSNNVRVYGVEIRASGTSTGTGLYVNGGGGNSIVGNGYLGLAGSGTSFLFNNTKNNTATGNVIWNALSFAGTEVAFTTSANVNIFTGNSLFGTAATGITTDSSSNSNILFPNTIDSSLITTTYTDAGAGNYFSGSAFGTGTSVTLAVPSEIYVCSSTCTVTPPVPKAGYQYCVLNGDNISTIITLAALGSSARYESVARTGYGTAGTGTLVSSGAVKDAVCILGLDATHYLSVSSTGSWTAN